MRTRLIWLVAASVVAASGCSTTNVALKYSAPPSLQPVSAGAPAVAVVRFDDRRNESPRALGLIRTGFGSPMKNLLTSEPVADVVTAAFADGVRARGFPQSDKPRYQISGVVLGLFCDQYHRYEAKAEIEVSVIDAFARKPVLTRTFSANQIEGTMFTPGAAFGSVDRLRAVAERTLREVVDKALDDPEVRAALR